MASAPPFQRQADPLITLSPFADPHGVDPALQDFLHRASSLLCGWLGSSSKGTPLPGLSAMPAIEPERVGLSPDRLLADLQMVMEGAYNPSHPGALAHLDPPPLVAGLAAELICAGLNNNLLAEELSPSLSRLERGLCGWLAGQIGMPAGAGGVAASGGTLSNLMALVVARQRAGLATNGDGVVLCSDDAHLSLLKALTVMGLPPQALIRLPVDFEGSMEPMALEETLQALAHQGRPVIAVVATAGTTVRGAVDPLGPIADLCQRFGHWLHVDGAIGAVFALADHPLSALEGLDRADSITVNPQKLLGIPKTSSLLLLADPSVLKASFATGLPYMEPSWGFGHGGEEGLQGTRPAEILKLWLGLRHLGQAGIESLLGGALARRRRLQELLSVDERLVLRSGSLHLLAFAPAGLDAPASDAWSRRMRERLLAEGLLLSRPLYQGRHHLKAVLGNPHTRSQHLEHLAALVAEQHP
ncbi:MAG: pyridoxal-dependent decarboxylase [Cyanobacteria bacterium]|nr:pyridoxal-dependent decarboxylase [Cyanobacteriota bacterium]